MYLTRKEGYSYKVIDIECNGLKPTQIWCCIVKDFDTGEIVSLLSHDEIKKWFEKNKEEKTIYVGHNIISFDVPALNRILNLSIKFEDCVDSLTLSYLYNPALEGGHSLEAWGYRVKHPKGDFSDWSKYSKEMEDYCINDVNLTYKVYTQLTDKMRRLGFSELSAEIEHKIRVIIDQQQKTGFWFDKLGAESLRSYLRERQSDLSKSIHKLFPPEKVLIKECSLRRNKDGSYPSRLATARAKYHEVEIDEPAGVYRCFDLVPFNLGSPRQRVHRLLSLGWEPSKFTETKTQEFPEGFPKVDEDALIKFAEESGRKEVSALAEWLVLQGRASMLDTWLNNLASDSRIHGKILTCGASTRRMLHSQPNTANIPSGAKAKYGHECRTLWGVQPGHGLVLVGYDAAGLETAGLCHYLNNPKATEVLLRPKPDDVHTANAKRLTEALGWEIDREWASKTSWYAWLYGAYEPKLGSIVGATKHGMHEKVAGSIVIETFFRNVPGLKDLINDVQNEWKRSKGLLRTIDGGFVRCHSLNAALNYKIQSAGAIVMKLAAIILDEEAKAKGIPFKKVGDIHDEGQLECQSEYADALGSLACSSITAAGRMLKFNVSLGGDYKIGKSWDETH